MITTCRIKGDDQEWLEGEEFDDDLSDEQINKLIDAGALIESPAKVKKSTKKKAELSLEEISNLNVKELQKASKNLSDDQINELFELEENNKNRDSVLEFLTSKLS